MENAVAEIKKHMAQASFQAGNLEQAKSLYSEACRLAPGDAEARLMLGNLNTRLGAVGEAEAAYREAVRLDPDLGEAHQYLGNLLSSLGRYAEAEPCYRQALRVKPHSIPAHVNLGGTLVQLGKHDEAVAVYREALAIDPVCRQAALGTAHAYERKGDYTRAYTHLEPYLAADKVDADAAMIFAALCRPLGRCEEAIALMERLLDRDAPPLDEGRRTTLHFRLGRLHDARNEYDDAFRHFKLGNDIKARHWHFDSGAHGRFVDSLMAVFTPAFLAAAPRTANRSRRPVFIVGMPRSGTSLVEQVLATHPAVFGAGELEDMGRIAAELGGAPAYPDCLQSVTGTQLDELAGRYLDHLATLSPHAQRVTDKMPGNFLHLGLIALLFPEARVIHCLRDPLDTCLSCYSQNFGPGLAYTYTLEALGKYYRRYQRIMDHWHAVLELPIMDVRYEDLVADQERVSRSLVDFCGLDWDDDCLRFYETPRAVITASYDQVRQPVYTRSVGRWRHYAHHLRPLGLSGI